ncbi:hypothetical protein BGW42_003390 [Actinomortierella wolfii]|nr:hypothetical protein BGW42_003390 [Actinomortierella wolfii]
MGPLPGQGVSPNDKGQQPTFRPPAQGPPHAQQQQLLHPQGPRPSPNPGQQGPPHPQQQHAPGGGPMPRSPIMSPFPRQDGQQGQGHGQAPVQGHGYGQGQGVQGQPHIRSPPPPGQASPHFQAPQQNEKMHQQALNMPDVSPKPAFQQLHVRPMPPGAPSHPGQTQQQQFQQSQQLQPRPPMGASPQGGAPQRQPSPGRPPQFRPMQQPPQQQNPAGHGSPQLRPMGQPQQRPLPPPGHQQQPGHQGIRPSSSQPNISPNVPSSQENPPQNAVNRATPPSPAMPTRSPQMMPHQTQTVPPGGPSGPPHKQHPPMRPSGSHPQLVSVGVESASQGSGPGPQGPARPPNHSPVQPHQQLAVRAPPNMNGSQQMRPRPPPPGPQTGHPGGNAAPLSHAGASDPANHVAISGLSGSGSQQPSVPASPPRHRPHPQQQPQHPSPVRPAGARPSAPAPGQSPSSSDLSGTPGTDPTHNPVNRPPQRPNGPPHPQQLHRRDSTSSVVSVGTPSGQDVSGPHHRQPPTPKLAGQPTMQQQQQPQFRPGPPPPGRALRPPGPGGPQHPMQRPPPPHTAQFMRPPGSPTQQPLSGTAVRFPNESEAPGASKSPMQLSSGPVPRSPQQTPRSLPSEKENAGEEEDDLEGGASEPKAASPAALPPPPMRAPGAGPPQGPLRGLNKVDPNKQLPAPMGTKEPPTSPPMGGPGGSGPNMTMRSRVRPPPGQQQHTPYRPPQRPTQTTPMMYSASGEAAQPPTIPTSPKAGEDSGSKDGLVSSSTIPAGAESRTTGMRPRAGSIQKRPVAMASSMAENKNMPPPKGEVISPPSPKLHGRKGPAMLSTSARQGGSTAKTLKKWIIRGGLAYLTYTTLFNCPPESTGAKGIYCKTVHTVGGLVKPYVEPHYTKYAGPHVDTYIKPVVRQGQSLYVNYAHPVVQGTIKVGGKIYDSTAKKHVDHAKDQIFSNLPYPLGGRKSGSAKERGHESHRTGTSHQPIEVKEVDDDAVNNVNAVTDTDTTDKDAPPTQPATHEDVRSEEESKQTEPSEHSRDSVETNELPSEKDHEQVVSEAANENHEHRDQPIEDSKDSTQPTPPVQADTNGADVQKDDSNNAPAAEVVDTPIAEEAPPPSDQSPEEDHMQDDTKKPALEKRQDTGVPSAEAADTPEPESHTPAQEAEAEAEAETVPAASEEQNAQPVDPTPEPLAAHEDDIVSKTADDAPVAAQEPLATEEQVTENSHEASTPQEKGTSGSTGAIPEEEPATTEPTEAPIIEQSTTKGDLSEQDTRADEPEGAENHEDNTSEEAKNDDSDDDDEEEEDEEDEEEGQQAVPSEEHPTQDEHVTEAEEEPQPSKHDEL